MSGEEIDLMEEETVHTVYHHLPCINPYITLKYLLNNYAVGEKHRIYSNIYDCPKIPVLGFKSLLLLLYILGFLHLYSDFFLICKRETKHTV